MGARRRWSKLQKEFYLLRAERLDFQLHCRAYPIDSQYGRTDLPRYWITLDRQIIWDSPKDFVGTSHPLRANLKLYPYDHDVTRISNLIREYIDTPKEELLTKQFDTDYWGLVDMLRAADKRIGLRRLPLLATETQNQAARTIVEARHLIAKEAASVR
jgi:hypothetical protein